MAYFYLTGTTTPAAVYTTSAISTPLSNPVVADSGGLLPPIYPDPTKTYRLILKDSGGSTIQDIDPVIAPITNASASITATMLASGAAVSNIGYTPANKAGDTITDLRLAFGATQYANGAGYLGVPAVTKNAIYTFAMSDMGKRLRHTDSSAYAWTIPPNSSAPFDIGTVIGGRNYGSGIITLTRGSGVTLTLAGNGTSKDLAAAQYAYWAIEKEDTDVWVATGTGLS